MVRPRGEIFLVGVPWLAHTEILAQRFLHAVFYNYVTVSSGWEGRMPPAPETHSQQHHVAAALRWLSEGLVNVNEAVYRLAPPTDPQTQYQDLLTTLGLG